MVWLLAKVKKKISVLYTYIIMFLLRTGEVETRENRTCFYPTFKHLHTNYYNVYNIILL